MDIEKIVARRVQQMPPSGIRAFFDLVLGMPDVISLGVGEPDFTTPWNICEAGISAIEEGYTSYTSNKGLLKLRLAIAKFLKKTYGINYNPDKEILITVGVSEGFDLAIRAIVNPGDKILVPKPCYVSYDSLVSLAGGEPICIELEAKAGFKLTPDILDKFCVNKPKAIILNYPANPTGVSYTKKELQGLAKVIRKYNLIVISDEIYDKLTYDFLHTPFVTLPDMHERTLYLNGFSKVYAMTGWRIGYVCGQDELISAITKIHQYTMLCASVISQMAACEALEGPHRAVDDMIKEYKQRREFIWQELNRLGLKCPKPQGAFYIFPSIKNTGRSSLNFAKELLNKQKVAVVPGTAFGKNGEGYIRISYASELETLKEAIQRIEAFLKR